jgi:hypothetical protein
MNFWFHGEDKDDEEYSGEEPEEDEAILKRYEKYKFVRKTLSIVVILVFVGVFVAPELARYAHNLFTGPPSPDYLSLLMNESSVAHFSPGVVRYEFKYDAHMNKELLERTFSQAAADWEGALGGTLNFEKAQDGEAVNLLIEIIDTLPNPGRSYVEFVNGRYRPRVELNAPDLNDPRTMRMVVEHELGHVMGIWGHSDYPGDLMYPVPERATPSRRDVRTIRLIYGLD